MAVRAGQNYRASRNIPISTPGIEILSSRPPGSVSAVILKGTRATVIQDNHGKTEAYFVLQILEGSGSSSSEMVIKFPKVLFGQSFDPG